MIDPDFTIFNPHDCRMIQAKDGQTVHIYCTAALGSMTGPINCVYVRGETALPSNAWTMSATFGGFATNLWTPLGYDFGLVGSTISGTTNKPMASFTINDYSRSPGAVDELIVMLGEELIIQSATTIISGTYTATPIPVFGKSVKIIIHWVAGRNFAAPYTPWLDGIPAFDLQWDLMTGQLGSYKMLPIQSIGASGGPGVGVYPMDTEVQPGFTQGRDVTLAVLASMEGAPVIDLSTLEVRIRKFADPDGTPVLLTNTDAVDIVAVDTNHYFNVQFNLSSTVMTGLFNQMKQDEQDKLAQLAQLAPTDHFAAAVIVNTYNRLLGVLELRASHTTGNYISGAYPFAIIRNLS